MLVLLELFKQGLLRFSHRTPDTMPFPFELANVDTRAWGLRCFVFGHLVYLANRPSAVAPGQSWAKPTY